MSKQLFVIPWSMYDSIDIEDLRLLTDDLIEMGLYKLPYPKVDILLKDQFGNDYIRLTECALNSDHSANTCFRYCKPRGDYDEDEIKKDFKQWVGLDRTGDDGKYGAPHQYTLIAALIGFLNTKNVVKDVVANKRAKLGIGKKANRGYSSIVYLKLPSFLRSDATGNGTAKRPHLRRGHIRRQHWGPKREFVKKVWIESVFVNRDDYDGKGSLDHTYIADNHEPKHEPDTEAVVTAFERKTNIQPAQVARS